MASRAESDAQREVNSSQLPEEKAGVVDYSVTVVDERVKQSVVALGDRHVDHEVDRVELADGMIVGGNRELNQLRPAACAAHAAPETRMPAMHTQLSGLWKDLRDSSSYVHIA